MSKYSVFEYLTRLSNENYSQSDLNRLVEICINVAKQNIFLRKSLYKDLKYVFDNNLTSISTESIAPLFIKSHDNDYPITRSFVSWEPKILNNKDAMFFLTQIISKRVEQHLAKVLKENNPVFSKILNNVNYRIIKYGLIKQKFCGITYISNEKFRFVDKKLLNELELDVIPKKYIHSEQIDFEGIFNFIKMSTNFYEALPLYPFIHLIKSSITYETQAYSTLHCDEKLSIDTYVSNAFNTTINKLKGSYVEKQKLNMDEYKSLKEALFNMAEDFKNGGVSDSLYEYLSYEIGDLSKADYNKKYRNILEYLFKLLKSNIHSEMKNNY